MIVLILPFCLNAQELLEVYQEYIPKIILQDKDYHNEIERNLEIYGELDPHLVYTYITNMKLKFEQNIQDPDSNLTMLLAANFSKAKRLKRQWASTSISKIRELYDYSVQVMKIESYYNKYIKDRSPARYGGNKRITDINLQYYFKYLYLSGSELKYNPSADYKEYYVEKTDSLIYFFESVYKDDKEIDSEKTEYIIQKAFKVPYIFKGSYLPSVSQKTDFNLFELIHKLIRKDYVTYNKFFLELQFEFGTKNRNLQYSFTDPMNYYNSYFYDFDIKNTLYVNMGYQFKIKEELDPASYIRLSVGYAVHQSYINTFKDTTFFSGQREVPGLYFDGDYVFQNTRNEKTYSLTSQFAFPVLYFNRKFFIEAEFTYTYQNLQFEFDFIKPGTLDQPFSDDSQPFFEDQVIKINENFHDLHFGLSLNYLIIEECSFRFEYLFPANIRLGISLYSRFWKD